MVMLVRQIKVVGQDSGYVDGPRPFAKDATLGRGFNVHACVHPGGKELWQGPAAEIDSASECCLVCAFHVLHAEAKERAREDELER